MKERYSQPDHGPDTLIVTGSLGELLKDVVLELEDTEMPAEAHSQADTAVEAETDAEQPVMVPSEQEPSLD